MPLLDLLWTMTWFFLFIAWIWLLFVIITDLARSRDLSGWAKGLWTLFIIFLPILGTFIYLIVRGGEMGERAEQEEIERDQMRHDYMQALSTQRGVSAADEIDKLARLRDSGAITEDEFQAQKAKLLAQA
jgi:hypothetical protein